MKTNYGRHIHAMDDDELERFVDEWMERKSTLYYGSERFSGAGDLGRDVVGYLSKEKLAGKWHNFQCKQLASKLGEPATLLELGKILYYSSQGEYSLPERFVFVAPRGVVRTVQKLIADPVKLKARVKEKWVDYCSTKISSGSAIPLTSTILAQIDSFDFSNVEAVDAGSMLKDPEIKAVLVRWFGEDPGEAPRGSVPVAIQGSESEFVAQLVAAYGEREGAPFSSPVPAMAHSVYGEHLRLQRQRYFDAAAFYMYYRDNTPQEYVQSFEDDIYHGVVDVYRKIHADTLEKVDQVMVQAAQVQASGVLAKYARVTVKQGFCHHFANARKMPWKT